MKEFKSIITNYKTSIPGIIALVAGGLYMAGKITQEQANWVIFTMIPIIAFGAKDHTK